MSKFSTCENVCVSFFFFFCCAHRLSKHDFPNQCSWLNGTIVLAKNDIGRKVDLKLFRYILADSLHFKKNNINNNAAALGCAKESKNKYEEYKENLRDFKNGQLVKLGTKKKLVFCLFKQKNLIFYIFPLDLEQAEKVYQETFDEFPDFLPIHMSLIQKIELSDAKLSIQWPFTYQNSINKFSNIENVKNHLKRIKELANLVIDGIDVSGLLAFYGLKTDSRSDALKIKS